MGRAHLWSPQYRKRLGRDEQFDAAGNAWLASDQAGSLQSDQHLMHRGRRDREIPLDVRFGGRATQHTRVGIDERQVLTLLRRKRW
jgi:hypothetical protein